MITVLLKLCGIFYAVLCIFSIVTGLMYASGRKELNPLELSDSFMIRYADPGRRRKFAMRMGWVTFLVGIVQGITAFAILKGSSPAYYWIAMGFTLFSIASVTVKLRGKISRFALLKCFAYLLVLCILLVPAARALFFG